MAVEQKDKKKRVCTLEEAHRCIHELEELCTKLKYAENLIVAQRDLAVELSATHNLIDGLRLCVDAAIKVSGLDSGGAYLIDEDTENLNLAYHAGLGADFVSGVSHFNANTHNADLILKGKPIYATYKKIMNELSDYERNENLHAIAVIPILHENRVIASVNIASHSIDEVPLYTRNSLEIIAGQMGNAIARLKAEEELELSENKYRDLVENTKDIIYVLDSAGRIASVNKAVKDLLGYEPE